MLQHINSLLHVSALQRRYLQGAQYQSAQLLPNVVKANETRAVYFDCLCGGMLFPEDGASEAPKHVGVTNVLIHLLVFYSTYENAWSELQKKKKKSSCYVLFNILRVKVVINYTSIHFY
jgi:hypothetical protein